MSSRRLSSAAIVLLTWFVSALVASQGTDSRQAALPRLTLDLLPPAVRERLERIDEEARTRPQDASAAGRLAMALHAQEQYHSADAAYQRARQLDPKSFAWAYLHGLVQTKLGQLQAAAGSLRQALAIDPEYVPARVALADALIQDAQLEAARTEYSALVRDYPELALAHYGYGRAAAMLGDGAAALEEYRAAVELAPQFGVAHYALALAYRDAGFPDRAATHLDAYRRLGARRPMPPDPLMEGVNAFRSTARDLIAAGARLEEQGLVDESIARHLEALEADPTTAQAHVNLISLYGRKGQIDSAQRHYKAALKLEGDHAGAHYNWGVLLAGERQLDEAADAFRRALEVSPFHPQAHNNLATLLAGQGKLDDAATHYRQAIANDPGHRVARFNLGRVLIALGRPREAAEQFERLLGPEDKDTPRFTYALATAWLAARDLPKARKYGEQALQAARRLGQTELAAKIEQDLERMNRR
jgi:tetratricopeptide (TPR) repeat protein